MNADSVITALELPSDARVGRRVPKTLLVEHGAPTAADKRRINEGVDEVQWVATLRPATIAVPALRDDVRDYSEIAVLSVLLRSEAKVERLAGLIHRAVPYPLFLLVTDGPRLTLALAHKRWSQGEAGATVLDGELVAATLTDAEPGWLQSAFQAALSLAHQPRANIYLLYQGWIDTLVALLAARVTGHFAVATSPEQAAMRREALRECARLETTIARLRSSATKEKQLAKQVALNLELQRAVAALAVVREELGGRS